MHIGVGFSVCCSTHPRSRSGAGLDTRGFDFCAQGALQDDLGVLLLREEPP
jgi:hypothetical protein